MVYFSWFFVHVVARPCSLLVGRVFVLDIQALHHPVMLFSLLKTPFIQPSNLACGATSSTQCWHPQKRVVLVTSGQSSRLRSRLGLHDGVLCFRRSCPRHFKGVFPFGWIPNLLSYLSLPEG